MLKLLRETDSGDPMKKKDFLIIAFTRSKPYLDTSSLCLPFAAYYDDSLLMKGNEFYLYLGLKREREQTLPTLKLSSHCLFLDLPQQIKRE
jgi:hypothetical protein